MTSQGKCAKWAKIVSLSWFMQATGLAAEVSIDNCTGTSPHFFVFFVFFVFHVFH